VGRRRCLNFHDLGVSNPTRKLHQNQVTSGLPTIQPALRDTTGDGEVKVEVY
jgi:hypothetical protein